MATSITRTRGAYLPLTITIQNNGSNAYADVSNGYSIEAQMSNVKGGDEIYDLHASFSNGSGVVNYDLTNIAAGIYYFDVKLGFPTGRDWTEAIELNIVEPITKP